MSTISTIIIRRGPAGPAGPSGPSGPSGASTFADIGGVPADNAALDAALDAKAPLASPTFTGTLTVSGGGSTGANVVSDSGVGANFSTTSGVFHALFGYTGIDQAFVARIKGAFGWIRGAFTGRIHPPDTLTDNRTWTLPNASGTIALTSDTPTTASIVTLLGVPTFATLAAANASGAIEIGKPFYNTALSKLDITTA